MASPIAVLTTVMPIEDGTDRTTVSRTGVPCASRMAKAISSIVASPTDTVVANASTQPSGESTASGPKGFITPTTTAAPSRYWPRLNTTFEIGSRWTPAMTIDVPTNIPITVSRGDAVIAAPTSTASWSVNEKELRPIRRWIDPQLGHREADRDERPGDESRSSSRWFAP